MPTAPIGQDDFYVRASDGGLTDVGPATPPAAGPTIPPAPEGSGPNVGFFPLQGASSDLSHALFQIFVNGGDVWPGDGTAEGFENLYEYVGSGKRYRRWSA